MNIFLGNIKFHEVEEYLGYRLTDEDKETFSTYHSNLADMSDKDSCFHIFHMPTCIHVKGEAAKNAVIQMFTPDKIVRSVGKFQVYER